MITQNNTITINGAKALLETLKSLGVDTIFGYPGGIVLDVYEELYKDNSITHILTRHEQSAVHAAEGYARETGKCGVVIVTSGPGATNTVTGIVNAYLDGYPLIILTGQVFKNLLGKDAFQEADICNITKSCTKKTYQITSAEEIPSTIKEAFITAMSGKKGPVVVDMVKDIFKQDIDFKVEDNTINSFHDENNTIETISKLSKAIEKSQKPIIVAGGGVRHANAEDKLFTLSNKYNIPVINTMMGLGSIPKESKNYLGMIGIFGDNSANKLIEESDLVISLGARFNDRITCRNALNGKLFQIDINPDEISKNIEASDFIIGNIKEILSKVEINKDFSNWLDEALKLKSLNTKPQKTSNRLHSFEVIEKIEEFTKNKNLTFSSEVGQHQLWTAKGLSFNKDRKIMFSGGSGTMGFGFPAALGASIASPNKTIVCISGDGSFQMGLHELATCKDYNLNIKIMILNNGYLGMVRQLQEKLCDGHYSQTKISNPDFVTLANSYGIKAIRVSSANEIESALQKAFSTDETFIIDFVVEPMETL